MKKHFLSVVALFFLLSSLGITKTLAQLDHAGSSGAMGRPVGSYEEQVAAVQARYAAVRTTLGLGNAAGLSSSPESFLSDSGQPSCFNVGGGSSTRGGDNSSAPQSANVARSAACNASSNGAPVWLVNMVNLNFYMIDTPLWYTPPIGPSVDIKLSYNSRPFAASGISRMGNKWQLNYASYLYTMSDNSGQPAKIAVIMPDGKWDLYGLPDGTGVSKPPYHVFNTLTKISANRFELHFPDGRLDIYDSPVGTTFNGVSLLVESADAHGQRLTFGYDANAKLMTITDALGKVTSLSYNDAGLVSQVTDPFGRFASFDYDTTKNLTKITDMGGYWTSFTYGNQAYLSGFANAGGSWGASFEPADGAAAPDPYPAPGAPMGDNHRITITNPVGGKEEFFLIANTSSWHISPQAYRPYVDASTNNANPEVPKTIYGLVSTGSRGEVGLVSSPEGNSKTFSYEDRDVLGQNTGNLTAIDTTGSGSNISYTYNARGSVTSITRRKTDGRSVVTNIGYDANGVDPITITDHLGTIRLGYNNSHDILSVTDRMGSTRAATYNSYGQLTSVTDPLGVTTSYVYGADHFLSQVKRQSETLRTLTYDTKGRAKTATNAAGITLTYDFNDLDDLVKISYQDGKTARQSYSASVPHLVTGVVARSGQTTQYEYSADGLLTRMVDPAGGTINFDHDANGNPTKLTDRASQTTGFGYDHDNRLASKTMADGTAYSFAYDAAGRLDTMTNARKGTVSYTYDGPDTVKSIQYAKLATIQSTPWLMPTSMVWNQYDQDDRLISTDDDTGTSAYSYDANSQLTSIDGPLNGDTLTFQYDAKGRFSGYILEGGQGVSYSYDGFNRLTTVATGAGTFVYAYSGASPFFNRLTRPNGSYTEYQYDQLRRLIGVSNRTSSGAVINQYQYTYNGEDLRATETVVNGAPFDSLPDQTVTYSYNNVNELSGSTNPARTFAYDADGNLTTGYTPDGTGFTADYDSANRLTSLQYFGPDQCAVAGYGTYPCDHERNYRYRADGMLAQIERWDGSTKNVVNFLGYGALVLQERDDATNQIQREYTWGLHFGGGIGGLLSLRQGGQDYYYLYDGKGNVTAIINSAQAVVATYAYDPFGKLLTKTGSFDQPYQFSTKQYDVDTGLAYFGYRFYSPELKRWTTRDPMGEAAGLNLYGFVDNDPVNKIDPLGLDPNPYVTPWNKMDGASTSKEWRKLHEISEQTCPAVETERNWLQKIWDRVAKAMGGHEGGTTTQPPTTPQPPTTNPSPVTPLPAQPKTDSGNGSDW